jgi:FkbM family methyltransferase
VNFIKTAAIAILGGLPSSLKNSIFHLSFNIARPEFDRFAHLYAYAPNMELGLAAVARRGIQPAVVIDVGAFEGDWSRMARQIWPSSKILMFEPNSQKKADVDRAAKEIGATAYNDLLGADDGQEVTFNVMGSGSSIMSERSPLDRTQETRRLSRLDSTVLSATSPTFLKIDAQGYELEVLKGAQQLLPSIEAILLEVAIIEINEGAPILADVVSFMKTIGFVTCEILEIHRRPLDQALNQIDILFVRAESILMSDKRHFA